MAADMAVVRGQALRDKTPLAGARVGLEGYTQRYVAITDDDGRFEVQLPAGDYTASVEVCVPLPLPSRVQAPPRGGQQGKWWSPQGRMVVSSSPGWKQVGMWLRSERRNRTQHPEPRTLNLPKTSPCTPAAFVS